MKFIGTKTLETDRLILRKVTAADAIKAYQNWCSNDNVARHVAWEKHKNVDETQKLYSLWEEEYQDPKTFRWIVELKDNGEVIGTIDVSKKFLQFGTCEIGYCYGEKFWGQGYGTEALKRVMEYLFKEADADVVWAEHMTLNPASGKVMAKAGLKYETILHKRVNDKSGHKDDLIVYYLTKEDYLKEQQNG